MAVKKEKAGEKGSENKLTHKQSLFVKYYSGNATEAALKAGYKEKRAYAIGSENLKKPEIVKAIQERQDTEERPQIANRQDRQKFWSEVMSSAEVDMKDRLKASELLGKSDGDFLDRIKLSGDSADPVRFIVEGMGG